MPGFCRGFLFFGTQKGRTKLKKIIIDCDPGIDDALALIFAIKSSKLNVIGITICAGNVPTELGVINAYKVLKLLGREDIPIYCGNNFPIKRKLITAQDTHGEDGLGEVLKKIKLPKNIIKGNAIDYILKILKENNDISIIALGPLTNLAKVIKKDSNILNKAKQIISMGGAFRTNGNCSQVSEFNYWVDPESVNIVFENIKTPIHLIPLDVTRKIVLSPNLREYLKQMNTPISKFIYDITNFYVDFHWKQEKILGCVINDPLVIGYLLDKTLCEGFLSHLECVEGGKAIGQSLIDVGGFYNRNKNVYINTEVNQKKFFKLFFNTIFPEDIKTNTIIVEGY